VMDEKFQIVNEENVDDLKRMKTGNSTRRKKSFLFGVLVIKVVFFLLCKIFMVFGVCSKKYFSSKSQRKEKLIKRKKQCVAYQSNKLPFRYNSVRRFQRAHQENKTVGLLPQSSISVGPRESTKKS
jgi:hypothetical protein